MSPALLHPMPLTSASVGAAWGPRQCCTPGPFQSPVLPLRCSPTCHQGGSIRLLHRLSSGLNPPRVLWSPRPRPCPTCYLRASQKLPAVPCHYASWCPWVCGLRGFFTHFPSHGQRKPCSPISHREGAVSPGREPCPQWHHLWQVINPSPFYHSCLNKNISCQLWFFSCVYCKHGKVRVCFNWDYVLYYSTSNWVCQGPGLMIKGLDGLSGIAACNPVYGATGTLGFFFLYCPVPVGHGVRSTRVP